MQIGSAWVPRWNTYTLPCASLATSDTRAQYEPSGIVSGSRPKRMLTRYFRRLPSCGNQPSGT